MKIKFAFAFIFLFIVQNITAQEKPGISEIDRVRIAEAFRIDQKIGNKIWKDWNKIPFAVLLITPENEFLIRHPKPSADFALIGYDKLLKSRVYFRKRVFSPNLLATFPAVGGVSTVVIGQAENTAKKNSTDWVVTLLHEHFHQLQNSQPGYYAEVEALDLAGGDQTGMWMLNYAFPYSSIETQRQFTALSQMLGKILEKHQNKELPAGIADYLESRRKLAATLKPADYRYFSFQLWQEGVARYTEYRIAESAGRDYQPSKKFRALKDYKPFKTVADETLKTILRELNTLQLENYKRVAFYPFGAGEALLLDRANPQWKENYFKDKFYLDKYFQPVR